MFRFFDRLNYFISTHYSITYFAVYRKNGNIKSAFLPLSLQIGGLYISVTNTLYFSVGEKSESCRSPLAAMFKPIYYAIKNPLFMQKGI